MKDNITESFTGLWFVLFIVFLVLKLTGTITWSWWMVTLPLWIGPVIVTGFMGIGLGIAIICGLIYLIYSFGYYLYNKARK